MSARLRQAGRRNSLRPPALDVPHQGLVLTDVTVVNPGVDRRPRQTLVVQGDKVVHVGDTGQLDPIGLQPWPSQERPGPQPAGKGAPRYAGCYVLPGLIDMHVHYPLDQPELAGLLFLAHGVTTVRDMGNKPVIWKTRRQIARGTFPAPRLVTCGPVLDGPSRTRDQARWSVRNAQEAQRAVERLVASGSPFIKVMDNISAEALTAVCETAARHGLPVIGHIPWAVRFEEAGLSEVQHLWAVQPLPESIAGPGDYFASWRDITPAGIAGIVRISAEKGIAHTPTLILWERVSRMADSRKQGDPAGQLMPRYYREVRWNPQYVPHLNLSVETQAIIGAAVVRMKEVVGRLHQAGVPVYAGTDTASNPFVVPGVSLQEELRHLVEAGLSPERVWAAATRRSGDALGEPGLGILQEGAPADLLIFRQDPTRNLHGLTTLEAVVARGRLYPKALLDRALARQRRFFTHPWNDRLWTATQRRKFGQP